MGITKHKDLFQLLSDHPAIDTLIYTSNFVKSEVNAIIKGWHTTAGDSGKEFTVKINDKVYKVKVLYSPSPNALRNMGPDGKERRKNQYKSFLKAD